MGERTNLKASSLIELLLYIAIASTITGAIAILLSTALQTNVRSTVAAEVEQQGEYVIKEITQAIRNADAVNSPALGTTAASLSLDVFAVGDDPTIFALSGSQIVVTKGAAAAVSLTNNQVVVSNLQFRNLSRSGTPGTIRITFTITHINPGNIPEYNYSDDFYASATLKN